jgi:broad specificity phosphatase PhoE
MPSIIIACCGDTNRGAGRQSGKFPDPLLSLAGQEQATRMALELKRDQDIAIKRIACSGRTNAYQTALVMALVLDIPMSAIRRDERLDECAFGRATNQVRATIPYDFSRAGGEDHLMVLARHLSVMLEHGHGMLDSAKTGLLLVGHSLGLKTLSNHFRQPGELAPGQYRLLRL